MNDQASSARMVVHLPKSEYRACLRLCKQARCGLGAVLAAVAQRALRPGLLAAVHTSQEHHLARVNQILTDAGGYEVSKPGTFRLQARLQPEAPPQKPAAPPIAVPAKPGPNGCSIENRPDAPEPPAADDGGIGPSMF